MFVFPRNRIRDLVAASVVLALTNACGGDSDGDDTSVGATSTTAPSTESAASSATTDAAATGTVGEAPYQRCEGAPECFLAGFESCILPGAGTQGGFCTVSCGDASECDTPSTGTAVATCEDLSGDGPICYLECSAGTCPGGMACNDQLFASRAVCFWLPA